MAPSRIDELRRRVQSDPASIAFAQLAEEYRRAGQTDEAVRVCREGLTRHPGYLSARVTLGRALLDLGQLDNARDELEFVVAEAPENLAAVRGLAEIFHREGQTSEALTYYQRALALARHDPEIEEIVQQLSRQVGAAAAPSGGLSFEEAHQELLSAAERLPQAPASPVMAAAGLDRNVDHGSTAPFDFDRLVAALGSPAAPPQVEAAVAGESSAVTIELPDLPSLGADPFAALEAELRASEQAHAPAAPWAPPEPVAPAVPSLDEVLADTLLTNAGSAALPDEADADADTAADATAPSLDDQLSAAAGDTMADPFSVADELVAAPDSTLPDVLIPVAAHASSPANEVTAADGGIIATPAPAQPAETAEGVLDELEGWLSTLQDRTGQ